MNTKRLIQSVMAVVWLGAGTHLFAEEITYYLVDYPDDQNGWTLSGSITTNGTIGTLSEGDITAWDWLATKPGEADEGTTSPQGTSASLEPRGIGATLEYLFVYPGQEDENAGITLYAPTFVPFLQCRNLKNSGAGTLPIYSATSSADTHLWFTERAWQWVDGRVIARVPEPGTLMLCCVGTVGLLVYRRRRKQ